jgi:hypothetical protein
VDKLGHKGCFSGFDVLFQQDIAYLAVREDLSVQGIGRGF